MRRVQAQICIYLLILTTAFNCYAFTFHPQKKALDSEYRNRYELYYLSDGSVKDSRVINWRDVEWEKVVKITVNMAGHKYTITDKNKSGFKGFMNFRWGGEAAIIRNGRIIGRVPINIWTIGWTDGRTCYLEDIDFRTCRLIKHYTMPLKALKSHIHPRLKIRMH